MKLLIDTREQKPFSFERYQVEIERATLPAGDYSLPGFEQCVAIERKELNDLIGCLCTGRERFERDRGGMILRLCNMRETARSP